jgi:hypothetical protein
MTKSRGKKREIKKARGEAGSSAELALPLKLSPWVCAGAILIAVLLVALIRVRLRDMPLERDEGEYAYAGQLILQKIPPYKLAYNMKLPGTYAAYAVILFLFGQSPSGIHLGLFVVNAATIIMMFFLARRLFGDVAGVTASIAYAFLSANPGILGLQAHATHFVVLAAVGGLILLEDARSTHRLFWSGVLLGIAFLMKQPGIFFAVFAAVYLIFHDWQEKFTLRSRLFRLGAMLLGVALPLVITCLVMWWCGVFPRFWFWVFDYARAYGSVSSLSDGVDAFERNFPKAVGSAIGIWLLAAVGLTSFAWDKSIRKHFVFCLGLALFSFLAVCPALYFRPHYFILMLPIVALLAGLAVSSTVNVLHRLGNSGVVTFLPALIFLVAVGYVVIEESDVFFRLDPIAACRVIYPYEMFVEAQVLSDYVKRNSDSTARIAMVGSDPEVYFYSQRHSATGYIYSFPLAEDQPYAIRMQAEMISEIEAARPDFLVFHPAGWILGHNRGYEGRLGWISRYVENYDLVGVAEHVSDDKTDYYWNEEARTRPLDKVFMYVFRRKRT